MWEGLAVEVSLGVSVFGWAGTKLRVVSGTYESLRTGISEILFKIDLVELFVQSHYKWKFY